MHAVAAELELSVIAPARNEAENLDALIRELHAALEPGRRSYEIIIVDDGSTDATAAGLRRMAAVDPRLRPLTLAHGLGQSAAFAAGIRAARGRLVATLDADLQNDPADLPVLLARLDETGADLVQGDRTQARQDGRIRQLSSWVGYRTRRLLLGDTIRDTGCSLRVMRAEVARALPLELRGLHRFVPVTARQMGFLVVCHPVSHRPRVAGTAQYGVWNRALPGLIDCLGVRWMKSRRCVVDAAPLAPDPSVVVTAVRPPAEAATVSKPVEASS